MKKNINSNNKSSGSHSFYKEANKSILGQQQMTPKKFGKLSFKVIKWMVFAFLIITTLWGCVNEFILKTSNNLGQGVEFYQESDFIYPNMYQATEVVGYTASSVKVSDGTGYENGGSGKKYEDGGTIPPTSVSFNFYVMNPNFGLNFDGLTLSDSLNYENTDEVENALNVDEQFIKSSDIKKFSINEGEISSITDAPKAYSYNLNELTVMLTGIYNYDVSKQIYENKGLYSLDTTISKTILGVANKDVKANLSDDDNLYSVTNMKSLAFYLEDLKDSTDGPDGIIKDLHDDANGKTFFTPIKLNDDDTFENPGEYKYSEISGIKGVVQPNKALNISAEYIVDDEGALNWAYNGAFGYDDFNFVINDKAETTTKDGITTIDEDQETLAVNQFIRKQTFLSGDLSGEITKDLVGAGVYDDVFNAYGYTQNLDDVKSLSALTKDIEVVYSGAQLVVTPIKKGFPVEASHDSQILIDGQDENGDTELSDSSNGIYINENHFRSDGFNEIDLSNSDNKEQGMDYETQMYGWMLMDSSANSDGTFNMLRTYDKATEAAWDIETTDNNRADVEKYTGGMSNDESDYLYADQRREGWGAVNYGIKQDKYTVFDEKIKQMMNDESVYMALDRSIVVNGETISYTTATTFAGMTSIESLKVLDESYIGVLPQTTTNEDKIYERSILSDSIIPTRQDSWGESRVAFVGWDDWGKAWGVNYGPMYGMFVFPLAQISMGVGQVFNYHNSAWGTLGSIVVIVFLTRGLGALLSLKGTKNQMKMQEVQTDVAKIKARYSKYDFKEEPKMKQKQQQEIMALYRKNDVSPMGSLGTIFITMPIFISLWIIISALPAYKLVVMGNFSWAISSFSGIFGGLGIGILLLYLLVGVTVGLVQGVSSKLPNWLANKRKGVKRVDEATKQSMKKQNRTQNIMVGVFVFMGLTVPALFAFYWIVSGSFTIVLELSRHGWRTHTAQEIKLDPTYKTPTEKLSHSVKSLFHK